MPQPSQQPEPKPSDAPMPAPGWAPDPKPIKPTVPTKSFISRRASTVFAGQGWGSRYSGNWGMVGDEDEGAAP